LHAEITIRPFADGDASQVRELFIATNRLLSPPDLRDAFEAYMATVDTFLTNMYSGARADFVYTVTRDFVRNCQTPILVLPDDVPGHPYAVAMETVHLAPNAQVSLYPWKDTAEKIPLAVRHIRTFLRAHRPVAAAAPSMAVAAQ
jgi:hypothetical protein